MRNPDFTYYIPFLYFIFVIILFYPSYVQSIHLQKRIVMTYSRYYRGIWFKVQILCWGVYGRQFDFELRIKEDFVFKI